MESKNKIIKKSLSNENLSLRDSTLDLSEKECDREDGMIRVNECEDLDANERLKYICKCLKMIKLYESNQSYYEHLFFICRGCLQINVLADVPCYQHKNKDYFLICEKCYDQLLDVFKDKYDKKSLDFDPETGFCKRYEPVKNPLKK